MKYLKRAAALAILILIFVLLYILMIIFGLGTVDEAKPEWLKKLLNKLTDLAD